MFLTEKDYKVMIGEKALSVIEQAEAENRERAESMAQEEIAGYLRGRYDVEKVFGATGAERNHLIVMYACDVSLYHLVSWLPQRQGYELRKERYERAIKWLEGVNRGLVTPDLPLLTGENGEIDPGGPVKCNPGQKNSYHW